MDYKDSKRTYLAPFLQVFDVNRFGILCQTTDTESYDVSDTDIKDDDWV